MIPLHPHLQNHVHGFAVLGSKGVTPLAEGLGDGISQEGGES